VALDKLAPGIHNAVATSLGNYSSRTEVKWELLCAI
jgi:hypothetical protein